MHFVHAIIARIVIRMSPWGNSTIVRLNPDETTIGYGHCNVF